MPGAITIEKGAAPIPLEDQCVIGRKRTVDVVINDQRVSREHAMIREEGEHYVLFDLDSANGTLLNGVPVSRPTRLHDGDRIQIGDSLITFQSEKETTTTVTQTADATIIGFAEQPMLFLVADVKGYTTLSSKLSDTELTDIMRQWYAECEDTMRDGGAIIDKFIGDCVFAYWMTTSSAMRDRALVSAQKLLTVTKQLADKHKELLSPLGLKLECGVSLHRGFASLGAMVRGQKTALGDAVNLAFRLESLTRQVGSMLLISKAFTAGWESAEAQCVSCGCHHLKGIEEPVEVFKLREDH